MDDGWPFPDPPHTAVITLERILRGTSPIRLVTHDDDDNAWQFLDGDHIFESDAAVVSLGEILQFDPTLHELATLPPGWFATRPTTDQHWQITQGESPDS